MGGINVNELLLKLIGRTWWKDFRRNHRQTCMDCWLVMKETKYWAYSFRDNQKEYITFFLKPQVVHRSVWQIHNNKKKIVWRLLFERLQKIDLERKLNIKLETGIWKSCLTDKVLLTTVKNTRKNQKNLFAERNVKGIHLVSYFLSGVLRMSYEIQNKINITLCKKTVVIYSTWQRNCCNERGFAWT